MQAPASQGDSVKPTPPAGAADPSPRAPGWRLLCAAIAGSILILFLCGRFVDWNRVFIKGMECTLNDQAGYIAVGRNLAEFGKLESTLIITSTVWEPITKNYMYVPGQYLALAAVYRLFGYSVAHSFWPALAGFAISSMLVVAIAGRLFGRATALLSWAFFAFFPYNLIYAFTAMAELTVITSALAAIAIFVWLPPRWRVWLGPLTLILPLLFRETGIVVAAVMAGIIFKDSGRRFVPVALFVALSLAVTIVVLKSPIASGRPTHIGAQTMESIWKALSQNVALLVHPFSKPGADPLQVFGVYFIASGIPIAVWLWVCRRDILYLAPGVMLAVILSAILGLYDLWWFRGIRVLLVTQPLVAMLWAGFIRQLPVAEFGRRVIAGVAVAVMAVIGVGGMYSVFKTEFPINYGAAQEVAFLESLGHDGRGLLASPWYYSLDYFVQHFPDRWAFVPGSDEELMRLNKKYPISTLVLQKGVDGTTLTPAAIAGIGLTTQSEVTLRGTPFLVFKRSTPPASNESR
jgi:hypothetical protein